MFYPARRHNQTVEAAARLLPARISADEPAMRTHPWQISPQWVGGHWAGLVQPGLVNGQPAAVTMNFSEAPAATQARIREERRASSRPAPLDNERVNAFLDEQPALRFQWRAIGADATPDSVTGDADSGAVVGTFEPVPEFFQRRGVASASTNVLTGQAETQRYLRACDIVISQPRVGFTNEITVGTVVDGSIVSSNPTFLVPPDTQPTLLALPKFIQPITPSLQEFLVQRFVDSVADQALLATVYALSPPNPDNATVTAAWNIFVRHYAHWNLAHAGQRIRPRRELPRLTFFTPLALGLGNLVISEILSLNNDFSQGLLDMYQQTRLAGKFYAV